MTSTPIRQNARVIERGWPTESSPFHDGERQVQQRVGVRSQLERAGRNMIRSHMPDQHRQLFEALPLLVVGSIDAAGRPWASLLSGEPGFIRSPSATRLQITAEPARGDPLGQQLTIGSPVGLLGIQLETRRRNRANGRIVARDAHSFSVDIQQSFGNCKQYIQAREPRFDAARVGTTARPPRPEGPRLSPRASQLLAHTDTFFIATASASAAAANGNASNASNASNTRDDRNASNASEGVDVSHRGGRPGFVRISEGPLATQLTIPDFRGNFMFNTFGNLEVNPRAGIVCADFDTGDILSLTGTARVIWEGEELDSFAGADRLLTFEVDSGVLLEGALPLRFEGLEPSPDLAETAIWAEAQRAR